MGEKFWTPSIHLAHIESIKVISTDASSLSINITSFVVASFAFWIILIFETT